MRYYILGMGPNSKQEIYLCFIYITAYIILDNFVHETVCVHWTIREKFSVSHSIILIISWASAVIPEPAQIVTNMS